MGPRTPSKCRGPSGGGVRQVHILFSAADTFHVVVPPLWRAMPGRPRLDPCLHTSFDCAFLCFCFFTLGLSFWLMLLLPGGL